MKISDLPPDIRALFFHHAPVPECSALSRTCSLFFRPFRSQFFYEKVLGTLLEILEGNTIEEKTSNEIRQIIASGMSLEERAQSAFQEVFTGLNVTPVPCLTFGIQGNEEKEQQWERVVAKRKSLVENYPELVRELKEDYCLVNFFRINNLFLNGLVDDTRKSLHLLAKEIREWIPNNLEILCSRGEIILDVSKGVIIPSEVQHFAKDVAITIYYGANRNIISLQDIDKEFRSLGFRGKIVKTID